MEATTIIDALVQHFRSRGPLLLLESALRDHPHSRYTYLAADPQILIQARSDQIEVRERGKVRRFQDDPWSVLQTYATRQNDWFFGYLGYDLKNFSETLQSLNPDPVQAPDMLFFMPRFLVRIDHQKQETDVLKGKMPHGLKSTSRSGFQLGEVTPSVSRERYLAQIKRVQQRITEGDFYEVNLSHPLSASFEGDPFALYREMRALGPVPFGAFMHTPEFAACSMSPERFLKKEGDTVFSQPIKGTIGRDLNEKTDEELKQRLFRSKKNRAENLMIVDLVRNDLSRVAVAGSVEVPNLFEIQTFKTVHQMVSTVQAKVRSATPVDILRACFPMGSMTGTPKISAMKAIEELESYKRGIYSGAIGYITPGGNFDFNVVIRTAIVTNQKLYYPVGGAITSDSDPHGEWEETMLKARALTDTCAEKSTR